MAAVGPVTLGEVRRVLLPRLAQLDRDPPKSRFGRVFVGDARRAARAHVPRRVRRRPRRARLPAAQPRGSAAARRDAPGARPRRSPSRTIASHGERVRLRLAVGAATERCWLSYPRLDVGQGAGARAVVLRAGRRARVDRRGARSRPLRARHRDRDRRAGWRGRRPTIPASAIDVWEHDLAVLGRLLRPSPEPPAKGAAHYLLELNAALARSLRTRWARWKKTWSPWDGLVGGHAEVPALLAAQRLTARPYSVSALQRFAACPYQFLLGAIYRLPAARAARGDRPARSADARRASSTRSSATCCGRCASRGLLPIAADRRGEAQDDPARRRHGGRSQRHHDRLAPAIERVWEDEIDADARRPAPVARRRRRRRAPSGCRATSSSASACRSTTRTTRRACPIRS